MESFLQSVRGIIPFMPQNASTFSNQVDALYLYLWALTIFFTGIVFILAAYFAVKYRRRSPDEIPRPVAGSVVFETLCTGFMFVTFLSMFAWGAIVYFDQYNAPAEALDISVVGKQWMWKFQHPTGQREINELHVPIGRKVKLTMTTEDVIHSFFVPDFRIKYDVVPGRYTIAWFEATKTGRYHIFCAEYCGTNHSGMGGWVEVMEDRDYQNWIAGNLNQVSPIVAGQQTFQSVGCTSCHGNAGEGGRCPTLIALYGKPVKLQDGSTVTADESYIRESILNPAAKIVAGFEQPIMNSYQGQLTEEQLLQLVAYIKSLAPAQTDGTNTTTAPARENNSSSGAASPAGQGATTPDSRRANPPSPTAP